jgi:hypothetical protein
VTQVVHLASRDTLVTTFQINTEERRFIDRHWDDILKMTGEVIPYIKRGKIFESTASRAHRINSFIGLIENSYRNHFDEQTYLRCGLYACLLLFLSSKSFRFDFGEFCKYWQNIGMGDLNHLAHYVGSQAGSGAF